MSLDKKKTQQQQSMWTESKSNVNNFVYLGSRIDADGKSGPDIRRRIAITISKLNTMAPLWKSQSTEFNWRTQSTELKWRTLKACILPVAIYGCEAFTITQNFMD